jgi:hypothetical protein
LKGPARPAKHTRQTYIHEAFPWLLYQTRQGVICFAPFQQRDFNNPVTLSIACNHTAHTKPHAASGRKHALQYFDAKNDKSSPETGEGGRCDITDAHSVSRRADIVRPGCSREVVTKRRYTTRNNQNFTSEKYTKAIFCGFRRISDAKLPRFTFGRVLQRPAGRRVAPIERVNWRLLERLPAVSAIAAVATTTTISAASTATAAAVTATSAATATMAPASAAITAATAAASTAATATAFGLRPRFVHHQVASAEILAVQRVHRAIRIVIIAQFNERKSTRLARETIPNQIDTRGSYTDLREILVKLIFRRGKRKISDIELLHLPAPSARNPIASRGARRSTSVVHGQSG